MSITYKDSGVNIDDANNAKAEMKNILATDEKRVLNKVGAFSSLYDIDFPEYKNPVLVLKTEEPGSKQLLAFQHDRFESVCFDTINHLINDCIAMGARPLTVQDAIICGKLEPDKIKRMVTAFAQACKEQGCVLTGGETSEQPGVIPAGTYILTTSIVGIVEKSEIIDGSKINEGDIVLALESSGLHTNGYTLVRKLIEQNPASALSSNRREIINEKITDKTFLDLILEPHRCYYQTIKDLFPKNIITGLAHITGGGIKENLNRILPDNLDAEIDLAKYQILPIFKFIRDQAELADAEMLHTFNMSTGLTMVVKPENAEEIINFVKEKGVNCYKIGKIIPGSKQVQTINNLNW